MVVGNNDKVERIVVQGGGKIGKNQRKIGDTRCNPGASNTARLLMPIVTFLSHHSTCSRMWRASIVVIISAL